MLFYEKSLCVLMNSRGDGWLNPCGRKNLTFDSCHLECWSLYEYQPSKIICHLWQLRSTKYLKKYVNLNYILVNMHVILYIDINKFLGEFVSRWWIDPQLGPGPQCLPTRKKVQSDRICLKKISLAVLQARLIDMHRYATLCRPGVIGRQQLDETKPWKVATNHLANLSFQPKKTHQQLAPFTVISLVYY